MFLLLSVGIAVYLLWQGYPQLDRFALLSFPSSQAGQESPLLTTTAVTNIRVQPNISAPIIGKNKPGEVVTALDVIGEWQKVRFESGRIGYMFKSLLNPVETTPPLGSVAIGGCDKGYAATDAEYRVTGKDVNLREGPGPSYRVLRHQHRFLQLNQTMRVVAECSDSSWSRVRVINPLDLALSHYGWMSKRYLGSVQGRAGDTGISAMVMAAYLPNSFPEDGEDFASRLADIEILRRQAAEIVLKKGQCVRVDASELSVKSTLANLVIMVDCRNGHRYYFDEAKLASLNRADREAQDHGPRAMVER